VRIGSAADIRIPRRTASPGGGTATKKKNNYGGEGGDCFTEEEGTDVDQKTFAKRLIGRGRGQTDTLSTKKSLQNKKKTDTGGCVIT